MAKRANPFVEDYVPQSKIHVGLKQFNNNEDRLHKVYVKTLELLFKGAKKSPTKEAPCVCESASHTNKPDKMKQLFLGKDGSLLRSGNMISTKAAGKCKCGGMPEAQCAYCEVTLCGACQLSCTNCQKPHCSICTLVGSDPQICFSCYN